jgi:LysM repeat protein
MKLTLAIFGSLGFVLAAAGCACVVPVRTTTPAAMLPRPAEPAAPVVVATTVPTEVAPVVVEAVQLDYIVRPGDSLWKIAGKRKVLGDSMLWPILFQDNRAQTADPDLIEVGQRLQYSQTNDRRRTDTATREAEETPLYVPHSTVRHNLPISY